MYVQTSGKYIPGDPKKTELSETAIKRSKMGTNVKLFFTIILNDGSISSEKPFVDILTCSIFIVFQKRVKFELLLSGDTLWSDLTDVSKTKTIIKIT